MAMLEIVVGTYEELLLGYKIDLNNEDLKFEQSFTDHSHIGCVKSVAISKKGILASGSTDEVIRLFSLKNRIELGCLMQHEGSITSLEFFGKTHMFSSSEDGSICVWKIGKWECVRTLRGHKGPVQSFAIHPTGKMALSVSRDRTMKTWNLMTGRRAYTTNTKLAADLVQWSPDGTRYMIATNNKLDIYSVETSKVEKTIQYDSRIYVITFIERNTLVLTGEGGKVQFYDLNTTEKVHELSTDTNRVRGASILKCEDQHVLATASSDGTIQIWKITQKENSLSSVKLTSHDTKFRLTCLTMTSEHTKTNHRSAEESVTEENEEDQEVEEPDGEDAENSDDNGASDDISNDEVKDNPLQKTQKRKMPSKKTENSEKLAKISKNELVKEGTKRKRKRKKQRNKKEIKN